MARKRKKTSRKNKSTRLQSRNLPVAGQKYLTKGQFAEAIKVFRRLLKETGDEQWSELLLSSFTGRIRQLITKGMYKEALVIYGNMVAAFPDQNPCLHIYLLINAGRFHEAIKLYDDAAGSLTKKQKQVVEETLAALLLSGQDRLLDLLAEDSALRLQYSHAREALQGYSLKQDSDALASLQKIPFRSPYKNFRLALKGMIVFHTRRGEALSFFDKIDTNSPFWHLTSPYRHLIAGKSDQTGKELAAIEKQITRALEGLNNSTLRFLDSLHDHCRTPAGFFRYLITSGKCLGQKRLRQLCYRLLPHVPENRMVFQRNFGRISDKFEMYRVEALSQEIRDEYLGIPDAWLEACDVLVHGNNPNDNLKIALIYRHIAMLMEKYRGEYSPDAIQKKLEKSLEYDPDDKETYFKLIQLQRSSLSEQYSTVNTMLDTFPDDPEILLLGVETAIRRGAFKKASRLAAALLEIDPINTKVRQLLIDAHLGHAHKLAGQRKYELSCRECLKASSFDRANLGRGKIEIRHGLIQLLRGNESEGLELLQAVESKDEDLILAYFQTRMDAELLDMPAKWKKKFTASLKTALQTTPDKTTLLKISAEIAECGGEKHVALQSFRTTLTPYLRKGARLNLSKEEMQAICQTFHRRHFYDLLLAFGKKAVRRWPGTPIFQFHHICGKTAGGKKRLGKRDFEILDYAWKSAMDQGDKMAADLIDDFLRQNTPFGRIDNNPFKQFENIIKNNFAQHLVNGTEPTEEEIIQFFNEISSPDSHPDDLDSFFGNSEKEKSSSDSGTQEKETNEPINPQQLKLFP